MGLALCVSFDSFVFFSFYFFFSSRRRHTRFDCDWSSDVCSSDLLVSATSFIPIESNKVLSFLGRPTLSINIGIATSLILGLIGLLAGYFPARRDRKSVV